VRKLRLFVAVLAMVLMTASPAVAQTVDFEGNAVFVGTSASGAFANPNIGGAGFTFGPIAGASPELGYFVSAGGGVCIDTTPFGVC
jgi:hypothetical protein